MPFFNLLRFRVLLLSFAFFFSLAQTCPAQPRPVGKATPPPGPPASSSVKSRPTLAILPLSFSPEVPVGLREKLDQSWIMGFGRSKNFLITQRDSIDKAAANVGVKAACYSDSNCEPRLGALLSVDYVASGFVTPLGKRFEVRALTYDVRQSSIDHRLNLFTSSAPDELEKKVQLAARLLAGGPVFYKDKSMAKVPFETVCPGKVSRGKILAFGPGNCYLAFTAVPPPGDYRLTVEARLASGDSYVLWFCGLWDHNSPVAPAVRPHLSPGSVSLIALPESDLASLSTNIPFDRAYHTWTIENRGGLLSISLDGRSLFPERSANVIGRRFGLASSDGKVEIRRMSIEKLKE